MLIAKLEPSKHKKGRFLVHLADGTLLRVGEHEVVSFALYTGMDLDPDTQAELMESAHRSGLKTLGINLAASRLMSRKTLVEKLMAKEATPEEADEVADALERMGLLDDGQYAVALVKHYAQKGYGPYKLKDELYRKGVPKAYWEDALAQLEAPDAAIDQFIQRKLRGSAPDQRELKRLSDALARRGFQWQDISAALRRYEEAQD